MQHPSVNEKLQKIAMYTAFYPISLLYACVSFADAVLKVLEWCYTNVSGVSDLADIFQLHGSVIVFKNS